MEKGAKYGARKMEGYHQCKLKPYRAAAKAEKAANAVSTRPFNPQIAASTRSPGMCRSSVSKAVCKDRQGTGRKSVKNAAENTRKAAKRPPGETKGSRFVGGTGGSVSP